MLSTYLINDRFSIIAESMEAAIFKFWESLPGDILPVIWSVDYDNVHFGKKNLS